ncbi:MAG: DUF1998 domain-containing protein [Calditrichaeota bacterium]|nr:DUF1998 domain-containing protein [Calditrichota bacterium]
MLYNLPVVERLLCHPDVRALYVFPLKALEQDQAQRLRKLFEACGLSPNIKVGIYDGDTPAEARRKLRSKSPSILITNPDMLGMGILAYHTGWEEFLRNLRFVVIDELHIYRGIFGSHIVHILRRLRRICRAYGANPQFIAASATIAGAKELAEELTGCEFDLIDRSGAPSSPKYFLFFNPLESYLTFALKLFAAAVESGLKAIVFTKARRTTELLHRWLKEGYPALAARISSYRAGFLPEERREIEKKLLTGKLDGVISTSALELGIDVGGLDVCILVGYPGTVTATWQRAGRVGRSGQPATICLVAGQDQLDQYFLRYPAEFFARSVEKVIVDPTNEFIAEKHLVCAAREFPLSISDPIIKNQRFQHIIQSLEEKGELLQSASGGQWFAADRNPQFKLDIRAAGQQFGIELENAKGSLGSVSGRQVFAECHPGAIYLHRAAQYLVTDLNLPAKKVTVQPVDAQFYTVPLFEKDTEILEELKTSALPNGKVTQAKLKVTEQLVGYQKRRVFGQELISQHDLEFPPTSYQTVGLVIAIPEWVIKAASEASSNFRGGIHGVEHALLALSPLFALCDRSDMGGYSMALHPQVGGPAVFVYDGHPGGIGLSARLFEVFSELVNRTRNLIATCPCETGCPSCIHSPKCGHGNIPLDKRAAVIVLEALLGFYSQKQISASPSASASASASLSASEHRRLVKQIEYPVLPAEPPGPQPPAVWDRKKSGIIFDLETQLSADDVGGWSNISKMRLAYASVYRFPKDEWLDYWEPDAAKLIEVLRSADLVVGFNIMRFDYEVLRGYSDANLRKLPTYDIMIELQKYLGHRLSLNQVAAATLGAAKSADGLQSLEWWQRGEYKKVALYCRQDVAVTRDLFYHILTKGYLLFEKRGVGLVRAKLKSPLDFVY